MVYTKSNEIIISMSTIPSRISVIEPVIKSLINQTLKPDYIYINVPKKYKRFTEKIKKPSFLEKKEYINVRLFHMENDYGPASKFIGTLENPNVDNEAFVCITDDDVIKHEDWLKTLYNKFIALKQTSICSFVELNLGNNIIWGYLGYIFKKKMLNLDNILEFYGKIEKECFLVDDHWFTGYCHNKSIPIFNIPIGRQSEINTPLDASDSLVGLGGENNRRDVSEKCRKVIHDKFNTEFPFWCCIGCCKKGVRIKDTKKVKEHFEPHDINNWINTKAEYVSSTPNRNITLKKDTVMSKNLIIFIFLLVILKYLITLDSKYNLGIVRDLQRVVEYIWVNINQLSYSELSKIVIGLVVFGIVGRFKKFSLNIPTQIENFETPTFANESEIPKLVIQTYYDKKKIPQKVFENINEFAGDYKHIIFDDDEITEFLKKNYKPDVLKTFDLLKGAHKADLFRYCFLYKFGGIYLDIKTELIRPLDEVFNRNHTYSVLSIVRNTVYQGVIATLPGNPIFLKLIKFMINIVKGGRKYNYIIFTRDLWNNIHRECNMRPYAGINKNIENPKFNYHLFQEKCTKDKLDCYDGLDRHNLCCYIYEGNERLIKSRYADFPW